MTPLHGPDADIGDLAERAAAFITARLGDAPLGRSATAAETATALAGAITVGGIGTERAWQLLTDGVLANTVGNRQ